MDTPGSWSPRGVVAHCRAAGIPVLVMPDGSNYGMDAGEGHGGRRSGDGESLKSGRLRRW